MRFKDLIGKKSEPEVSPGRLVTAPGTPVAPGAPVAPAAPGARTAPVAPIAPIAPAAPSTLPDLFTRLLAAEQGEAAPPPGSVPFRLNEADVERIAARVAERLESSLGSDVRRIVADVSERLVREEIARIRRAAESDQP